MFSKDKKIWALTLLLLGSSLGLIASFVLSTEAIELAKNANVELPCSLNAVLNCAAVGKDPTAHIFGFPNAFIGMLALPVLITIAIAALGGTKFPKWFMFAAQAGAALGALFAFWMFYTSYFVIQILCPWCLTLDVAMIVIFFSLLRYNILEDNLYLGHATLKKLRAFADKGFDVLVAVLLFVAATAAIILKFGSTLFS